MDVRDGVLVSLHSVNSTTFMGQLFPPIGSSGNDHKDQTETLLHSGGKNSGKSALQIDILWDKLADVGFVVMCDISRNPSCHTAPSLIEHTDYQEILV
jgi:hypothetical protein